MGSVCDLETITYLANELWICLTKSKLAIASPRSAGLKSDVKSLNPRRLTPSSMLGILLTMFSNATLAQALLLVWFHLALAVCKFGRGTRLICEPHPFWTALLLLIRVFFDPFEQKDEAVDGSAMPFIRHR